MTSLDTLSHWEQRERKAGREGGVTGNHIRGKRSHCRWSPSPMDTRNPWGITSAIPACQGEIGYIIEATCAYRKLRRCDSQCASDTSAAHANQPVLAVVGRKVPIRTVLTDAQGSCIATTERLHRSHCISAVHTLIISMLKDPACTLKHHRSLASVVSESSGGPLPPPSPHFLFTIYSLSTQEDGDTLVIHLQLRISMNTYSLFGEHKKAEYKTSQEVGGGEERGGLNKRRCRAPSDRTRERVHRQAAGRPDKRHAHVGAR
ncbi:hypothetical protein EVAR_47026_1 [Eumeta japonica]|uniref:Uncharacterized protein n=1 Tax=Eumeta variegata TaxID=151549 RepID=A0A4C1XJV6_EUMVA|nr:hypothetical protein EVAR_47026_1 [Eumeta japonica]